VVSRCHHIVDGPLDLDAAVDAAAARGSRMGRPYQSWKRAFCFDFA